MVERLRECLRAEVGRGGGEGDLGRTGPPLCRMLLLGSAGRAGSVVQFPEVDPLSVMEAR